jgi:hypothetical protein
MLYQRIGDHVHVSFWMDPPNPAIGLNEARLVLPLARSSNFTSDWECTGTVNAADGSRQVDGYIRASTAHNNQCRMIVYSPSAGAITFVGILQYTLV